MWLSRWIDKLYYSDFYVHHTGFDTFLLITFMDKDTQTSGLTFALFEGAAAQGTFHKIHAGKNYLYIELPRTIYGPNDPAVCVVFDHHHLPRRHRVDFFLSPGKDLQKVHARLTASRKLTGESSETLFDGEVSLLDRADDEPFLMHAARS